MKSVVYFAAAAGLAGSVAAHVHKHEHLHKRSTTAAPSGTPCPQWTGGHRPPAYLTNLPLSVQTELPKWTGAPPPDWCSQTAWMESYVSCATVYASCNAKTTTTSSSTTSSNATTTGSTTTTTTTGSTTTTPTTTSTWGTWSDSSSTSADPATTSTTSSTSTWGSWTDSSTITADPATTSTTSTWGSWTDPSSTSADPATTSTTSTWESWADPSSTSAAPASTSTSSSSSATTFTGWGSWVDPASSSTTKAAVGTSSSSTAWGTWLDPASSSTTKAAVSNSTSSTAWGTWADPASSSVCGCTTVIVTVTGDPTWAPDSATTTSVTTTTYTTVTVVPTQSASSSSSSTTTTWGSWDPTTSSSSSSTSWGSWADGSSSSYASSTTFSTSWSTTTGSSKAVSSGSSGGGSGNAAISPAGSLWAITYSPYTASGDCKDAGSVTADITAIKALGFTTIRIYSTDCSGLENVGTAARAVGLKLILGVFIKSSGISGAQPQVSEIVAWGQWDLVEMVVIGNEALFNQYLSVSDLAGFISSSKWAFSDAGYTGPVTTTEPLNIWQEEGASLCGAIDVVAANIHAFFNLQTSASDAGAFIESELAILDTICPGKSTYVVESGWPHAGEANGAAVPGVAEQATALASIQSTCGSQVVFFTFEDDLWKAPGAFDVEQSWGCASAF